MMLLNSYKKAKRQRKLKERKEFLNKLYVIKNEVNKNLLENRTFIVLYRSSDCWTIAKNIFHNENMKSRGFMDNSNIYYLNYFGLLTLKILIWIYEKRIGDE